MPCADHPDRGRDRYQHDGSQGEQSTTWRDLASDVEQRPGQRQGEREGQVDCHTGQGGPLREVACGCGGCGWAGCQVIAQYRGEPCEAGGCEQPHQRQQCEPEHPSWRVDGLRPDQQSDRTAERHRGGDAPHGRARERCGSDVGSRQCRTHGAASGASAASASARTSVGDSAESLARSTPIARLRMR